MDLIAHAVYGATVCSQSGLAGGSKGSAVKGRSPWIADRTVWLAALFGVLPDVVSMGLPFLLFRLTGAHGNFFRDLDANILVCYRYMHSLIVALAVSGLLVLVWKPLRVPSLAWPLHVLMDSVTHGAGKFQTPLFYPVSTWGLHGIRWWLHPGVMLTYWSLLPCIWLCLWTWRRRRRECEQSNHEMRTDS